jgi:hypothetical protein
MTSMHVTELAQIASIAERGVCVCVRSMGAA